jgi:hypothetical protein
VTNHVDGIAAIDLFVLPTITFRLLYCLVILRHGASTVGLVRGDDKSDRGVDFAPDHRGVPVGQCTSLPYSGPGHCVWSDLQTAVACHGHSGQADCSPIAVAEPVRRETDRHDPTGMSRPPDVFGEAHLRRIRYAAYYNECAFIARWTRMPHSIGRLSASALSHHSLSSAAFITNIAESNFRHTQGIERDVAAEPPVHVDHVLFSDAEAPGDELDLVGAQVALFQGGDLALGFAKIEESFLWLAVVPIFTNDHERRIYSWIAALIHHMA